MTQHLLIGDVAPLLVVLGGLRPRVRPLVALTAWAANLLAWHLTPLYDAALEHSGVHLLQHALFFACGVLLSYYDAYSLSDQRAGGGVMLLEGSVVMLGVVVWLLLIALRDDQEPITPMS
jgi:Cytochrome c oxidase caa3 assembly factor (Caa3_CtaG)